MAVHPTAIVSQEARIAEGVEIGPYSVIGPHVTIGAGTTIANYVVIDGRTQIGERCSIFSGACIGTPPQDKKTGSTQSCLVIGNDNIIREYVTINSGSLPESKTVVGDRNFIMIGCHIAHDCVVGSDVVMANGVGLSGHVVVEDKAVIGGLSGVHQFVRIGKLSMTGGLSKVVKDIPPFQYVMATLPRWYGLNAVGLKRSGYSSSECVIIKKALKILFKKGSHLKTSLKEIEREFRGNKDLEHLVEFFGKSKRGMTRCSSHVEKEKLALASREV